MNRSVRAAAAAAFVVAAATACTSGGATHPVARPSQPAPTHTPVTTKPVVTTHVAIGPLQLALPPGWRSSSEDSFANICVEPAGKQTATAAGCGGLDIWYGWDGFLPGNEMSTFDPKSPGWYHGTGMAPCPVDPTNGPDGLNGIQPGEASARGLRPIGDRNADYYEWDASCESGNYHWTPRAWYLPISKILVFDYTGNPAADALLRTATFDRGRWTFGFLDGTTTTAAGIRVAFDEAQWLGSEAANDYASHHGMETPVPNDYLIVDPDTSTTPHLLASNARIVSVFALAGTEPGKERVVPVATLVAFLHDHSHWSVPFHVHLDPTGRIDQVIEQYRP